jgi:N,N'-diacetyllegionaminate synthase
LRTCCDPAALDFASPGCVLVAEVGQNHDGSLGSAHAYIDAIARAGADAVKFQTHIAAAESTPGEPWRVKFSPQDETRYDYWKRMEFTEEQWIGLSRHAAERGLLFLSSAFSFEAVDLLNRIGVPAWKVGAGETTNLPMIGRMARTGKPVVLSSGMSSWQDLDRAVAAVRTAGAPVALLQCTTMYPCPPEKTGINVMAEIRQRYGCPTGLSDHSGTIYAGLMAAALGADMVEVHVCLSRDAFGPDISSSITIPQLAELADGVRFIRAALANPVNKESMADELAGLRAIFQKSLVAARDLPAGRTLLAEDIAMKKPGTGIPAARFEEFRGRRLARPLAANQMILESDLDS